MYCLQAQWSPNSCSLVLGLLDKRNVLLCKEGVINKTIAALDVLIIIGCMMWVWRFLHVQWDVSLMGGEVSY